MSKETKAPVKESPPDTSKDESFLGALCEIGNAIGDMILSPLEEAVKETSKPSKDETPEVKPAGKETKNGNGNGSDKQSISINLGGLFLSDKRTTPTTEKKGKTPRVEEPADESDESAE